jgi:hypothetical protein
MFIWSFENEMAYSSKCAKVLNGEAKKDSNSSDEDFDRIASDETYVDGYMGASTSDVVDEEDMGGVCDAIAQALMENA